MSFLSDKQTYKQKAEKIKEDARNNTLTLFGIAPDDGRVSVLCDKYGKTYFPYSELYRFFRSEVCDARPIGGTQSQSKPKIWNALGRVYWAESIVFNLQKCQWDYRVFGFVLDIDGAQCLYKHFTNTKVTKKKKKRKRNPSDTKSHVVVNGTQCRKLCSTNGFSAFINTGKTTVVSTIIVHPYEYSLHDLLGFVVYRKKVLANLPYRCPR
jgi:hypothetical protein